MKNLFILGSPRQKGNSASMAKAVASGISQISGNTIECIYLNKLNIVPCQGCGACSKTGKCILNDDMQKLYKKTVEAERLFLVSPVYFYSITAQLKAYIDRCQALWARKYILNEHTPDTEKHSTHLLSCAATNGTKLFDGAELIIKCLCDTLHSQYSQPLLIKNVEEDTAISKNKNTIEYCSNFGHELAKG